MTAIQSQAAKAAHARRKRTVTAEMTAKDALRVSEILTKIGLGAKVVHTSAPVRASYRRVALALREAIVS